MRNMLQADQLEDEIFEILGQDKNLDAILKLVRDVQEAGGNLDTFSRAGLERRYYLHLYLSM